MTNLEEVILTFLQELVPKVPKLTIYCMHQIPSYKRVDKIARDIVIKTPYYETKEFDEESQKIERSEY